MARKRSNNGKQDYKAPGVERSISIMELLSKHPDGLPVSDISTILKIPKNSVYRVVMTLYQAGYLKRDDDSMCFTLSKKLLTLGYAAVADDALIEKSRDVMRGLRDITKETVCIGTMLGTEGFILDQILSLHPLKFSLEVGWHFPLYAGAPGKALLAFLPEGEFDRIFSQIELKRLTPNTITSRSAFREEMASIRRNGYSLDREEGLPGCRCIGAPILDKGSYPVATLWTTGPADRMPDAFFKKHAGTVVEHAAEISERIGRRNGNHDEGL